MLFLFVVFATGCLSLLTLGLAEQRRHYANLRRIPARVLINGIRGKSSITRLCAGALRGGGLVTVAKTTGTAARFIHPDGSEEPVYRKFGIANVVEQIGIVRRASAYRPDVLAIECMAVQPDLQEINQSKLIQSTIGVLCNVREDHLAEMGPTLDDVARSLSRSMPVGGVCVTAEKERLHILREEAARRECELVSVDPESVTDEQMAGFSWITFKENVAIALAVADLLGVNRQSALAGMWAAAPDPGVLSVQRYLLDGLRLRFANIFAANDPESTLMNIEQLLGNRAIERPLHVVINCRPDRIERNGQMGALIPKIAPLRVVLIGEATRSAKAAIPADWSGEVIDLGGRLAPEKLLAGVLDGMAGTASLVTIGNIHGQGEVLLEQLATLPQAPAGTQLEPTESQPAAHSPAAGQPRPAGSQARESHTATGLQPAPEPRPADRNQPTGSQSLNPSTTTGLHPISPQPTPEPWHTNDGRPSGLQTPEPWTATGLTPVAEPWSANGSQPTGPRSLNPSTATGLHPITPQPTPEPWRAEGTWQARPSSPEPPTTTGLDPAGPQPTSEHWPTNGGRPTGPQTPESWTATGFSPVAEPHPTTGIWQPGPSSPESPTTAETRQPGPQPYTATGLQPAPEPWHTNSNQPSGPQSPNPPTATGLRPITPQSTSERWPTNGGQPTGPQTPESWTATGLSPTAEPHPLTGTWQTGPQPSTATGLQPAAEPWSTNSNQPSEPQSPTPHTATGLHPITPQPSPEPWFTNDSEPAGPPTPEPWTATGLPPAEEPHPITGGQPSRPQSSDFPTAVGLEPVGPWPVRTKSPTGTGVPSADPQSAPESRPADRFRPSPVPRSSSASDTRPLPRMPDASTQDPRSDP